MNEQALRDQLGDMMLRAMNNKAEILAELLGNMDSLGVMGRGLSNFEEVCKKVENGETDALSPVAAAQMIRVLSKTVRVQAKVMLHLSCFALIYGNGDSYDGDASRAAMRFGKGNEALQAMLRAKFGGRNPFAK